MQSIYQQEKIFHLFISLYLGSTAVQSSQLPVRRNVRPVSRTNMRPSYQIIKLLKDKIASSLWYFTRVR